VSINPSATKSLNNFGTLAGILGFQHIELYRWPTPVSEYTLSKYFDRSKASASNMNETLRPCYCHSLQQDLKPNFNAKDVLDHFVLQTLTLLPHHGPLTSIDLSCPMGSGRNMAWHPPPLSCNRAAVLLRRHGMPCILSESKQTLHRKHARTVWLCKPRLGKSLTNDGSGLRTPSMLYAGECTRELLESADRNSPQPKSRMASKTTAFRTR
jgi:hypothetical protein